MRVLVFGDSITQGYWAIEHGWVDRLRMYFDAKQNEDLEHNDEPAVFNLGVSADTSEDVLKRVKNEVKTRSRATHSKKPVVILQIGINDSSIDHGKKRIPIDEYKKNISLIVENLKGLVSDIIFIGSSACNEEMTTPVFWGDYIYTNDEIKNYENAMAEVASENNISFIEIFDEFKERLSDDVGLVPDGLHPNDKGHELVFNIVKPKIEKWISNES